MTRTLVGLGATLLMACPALAQPPQPEIPVRVLKVSPAELPVPALRYPLLPELRDTTPGNAALLYYRAFAPEWSLSLRKNEELQKQLEAALADFDSPLATKYPGLKVFTTSAMLKEVDRAARRGFCDWELTPRIREDGIMLLLPDQQSLREFVRYLSVRARWEMQEGRFDAALHTLQTGLQLGRHVADGSTLIQALVGIAITQVMLNEVESWIGTPGSPNLYWALATLPRPYVDLARALQGEKLFIDNLFPGYREALRDPSRVPPPVNLKELQPKLELGSDGAWRNSIGMTLLAVKGLPPARDYLKSQGYTPEQLDRLPALTLIFLHQVALCDIAFDDFFKWIRWPYVDARVKLAAAEKEFDRKYRSGGEIGPSLAGVLLPATRQVFTAAIRPERRIQMLMAVEALRLHAARHGQFPESLEAITEVPVPKDPATGKPFVYERQADGVTLTAPAPEGEPAHRGTVVRLKLELRDPQRTPQP